MISLPQSKYYVATSQVLTPLIVIFIALATLYALFFSPIYKINKVKCHQDMEESCQNDFVVSALSEAIGHNLFLFDATTLISLIQRGDPTIRSLEYKKILPGTLELQIQSVYPTLALGAEGSSSLLILDTDLRIIKTTSDNPNVPIARYHKPLSLRVGERIVDEQLRQLLQACLTIIANIPGSNNCVLSDNSIALLLEDEKTQAVLTTERDLDQQLSALHTIRQGVTISGSKAVIDVRYQQPIIKGNN